MLQKKHNNIKSFIEVYQENRNEKKKLYNFKIVLKRIQKKQSDGVKTIAKRLD